MRCSKCLPYLFNTNFGSISNIFKTHFIVKSSVTHKRGPNGPNHILTFFGTNVIYISELCNEVGESKSGKCLLLNECYVDFNRKSNFSFLYISIT